MEKVLILCPSCVEIVFLKSKTNQKNDWLVDGK